MNSDRSWMANGVRRYPASLFVAYPFFRACLTLGGVFEGVEANRMLFFFFFLFSWCKKRGDSKMEELIIRYWSVLKSYYWKNL